MTGHLASSAIYNMSAFNRNVFSMTILKSFAIAGLCIVATVQLGSTQGPVRQRVLAESMRGHELVIYQRHGQDRAQILYHHNHAAEPISIVDARDLVVAIRKDLKAAESALAKIKAHHLQEPDVLKQIAAIEKDHLKANEGCNLCEHECMKEQANPAVISECCSRIWHDLETAQYETKKLLRMFKIERLEPPKRVESKAQAAAR